MDVRELTVDEAAVRWLEHGTGRPVVLVHGIPTSPRLWRHVLPLVPGRCLAWEMRGYGSSVAEGEGRDLSLTAQADYLLSWLTALSLDESPVIVGHDVGGGVAQIAAVRAPHRFSGLVLTNAVCYDSWPIPSVKMMQRLSKALRYLPDPMVYPVFTQLLHRGHDDRLRTAESIGVHWAPYVANGAARTMMRQMDPLDADDTLAVSNQLSSLDLPARVVWGEADQFQKVEYGERLARDLRTELTRIRGGRHFTPEDHPETIADAINDLIAT